MQQHGFYGRIEVAKLYSVYAMCCIENKVKGSRKRLSFSYGRVSQKRDVHNTIQEV